jgi:intein-encoded DNA endonuclease-like protein
MLFLIEYDRHKGQLVKLRKFVERDRNRVENARLELELELRRRGKDHEVVVLEAPSEAVLRRTHRRYFENLRQLAS